MEDARDTPHLLRPAQLSKLISGQDGDEFVDAFSCPTRNGFTGSGLLNMVGLSDGRSVRLLGRGGIPEELIVGDTRSTTGATKPSSETERCRNLWTPVRNDSSRSPGYTPNEASCAHVDDLSTPQHVHSIRLLGNRPAFTVLHPRLQPQCLGHLDNHKTDLSSQKEPPGQLSDYRTTLIRAKPIENATPSMFSSGVGMVQEHPKARMDHLSSSYEPKQVLRCAREFIGIPENAVVKLEDGDGTVPLSDVEEEKASTKSTSNGSGHHQAVIDQEEIGGCQKDCGGISPNASPVVLGELTNVLDNAAEAVVCELRRIRTALEAKAPAEKKISTTKVACHIRQETVREPCYNRQVAARLLTRLGNQTNLIQHEVPSPCQKVPVVPPAPINCQKMDALACSESATATSSSQASSACSPNDTLALPCPPIHMDPLPPSFLLQRSKRCSEPLERTSMSVPEPERQDRRCWGDAQQELIREGAAKKSRSPVESKLSTHSAITLIKCMSLEADHNEQPGNRVDSSSAVSESLGKRSQETRSFGSSVGGGGVGCGLADNGDKESTQSPVEAETSHLQGAQSNTSDGVVISEHLPNNAELSSEQESAPLNNDIFSTVQEAPPELIEPYVASDCDPLLAAASSSKGKSEERNGMENDVVTMELAELIIKVTGSKEIPTATVVKELGCSLEDRHSKGKNFLFVEDLTNFQGQPQSNPAKATQMNGVLPSSKEGGSKVTDISSTSSGRSSIDVDFGAFMSGHVQLRNSAHTRDAGCQTGSRVNLVNDPMFELSRICAKRANAARKEMRQAELHDLMKHIAQVRDLANDIEDDMVHAHATMKSLELQRRAAYRKSLFKSTKPTMN